MIIASKERAKSEPETEQLNPKSIKLQPIKSEPLKPGTLKLEPQKLGM